MTQIHDDYSLDTEAAGAELAQAGKSGGGGNRDQFKPKPTKDGQTYTNRLFFALIKPREIRGFEAYPLDHKLFYVKLFGHYVNTDPSNARKQEFVLCKRAMNSHVAGLAKNPALKMFEDDRCPSCEEADILWQAWNDQWAALGYPDKESKKSLSKEQYKDLSNRPEILALKDAALVHTVKDRYAFPVYDMEQQVLAKGFQWYMGPETVFKGLMTLVQAGVRFYSLNPHPHTPGAVEGSEILLGKDTTEGARYAKYTVNDNRQALSLQPEEVEYIRNQANLPDLSSMMTLWDYDTHKSFVVSGAIDPTEPRAAVAPIQSAPAARPAPAPVGARPTAPMATRAPAPAPLPTRGPIQTPSPVAAAPLAAPPVQAPLAQAAPAPQAAVQTPPPSAIAPQATAAPAQPPRPRRTW